MGLYFFEQGAMRRPSQVVYDRAHSAFALAQPQFYDWSGLLAGGARLHLSGVTPALGPDCARSAQAAAQAAVQQGLPVSFDGNFRARLWEAWGGDPAALLRPLMACADVLFANHRDIGLVLGERFSGLTPREAFRAAAEAAFTAFPRLRCFAATQRVAEGVRQQVLGATMALRDGRVLESEPYALEGIVDRFMACIRAWTTRRRWTSRWPAAPSSTPCRATCCVPGWRRSPPGAKPKGRT
jgi:2-dehydro-3-deoxygluconokinase